MESRLVLVRHGQSRATVDSVAGGEKGCRGLTDLGHRQAQALAARIASDTELGPVRALLSSTLPRAVETAERLAPVLGLEVEEDRDLCEMHPGEGDGLTWAEWDARYGSFDVGAEPERPLSPGGESWARFGARARGALTELATAGGTVMVVCHGGIIEQSMILGLGRPARTPPGQNLVTPPNTSLTEWVVDDGDWQLVRYADAAHLSGLT